MSVVDTGRMQTLPDATALDTNDDLEHLADHLDLVAALLSLRLPADLGPDERVLRSIGDLQVRIDQRSAERSLATVVLGRELGCSPTETLTLWILVAAALRDDVRGQIARFDCEARADPTLDTLRRLVYGERPSRTAHTELGPTGTLRRLELIVRSDSDPARYESKQTWTVSRRILSLVHGDNNLEPSLRDVCRVVEYPHLASLAVPAMTIDGVRRGLQPKRGLLVLAGAPGLGRRTLLGAVAKEAGIDVLEVDARRLAKEPGALGKQLRAIARECKLLARTPLICNLDALADDKEDRIAFVGSELVSSIDGLVLVTTGVNRPVIRWDRPVIAIEMGPPASAQRAVLWRTALGEGTEADAERLATQYPLAPAMICRAAEAAKARACGKPLGAEDVHAGIRAVLDDKLGHYARRVTVTQTWSDVVLPQDQVNSIIELVARIRERRRVYEDWGFGAKVGRGLGVSALLSGPPGTGKTMVAALIAKELRLELYQVDLAKIVSKWIGETEKNLAALFDAAEAGHAVLLFDEADAMFGKRTDVKSSNDRHANMETNYLLQRLESFTGICLLTTNHDSHIDAAFQRRLSMHLRFEMPEADERERIWRAMLPAAAPIATDLDLTEVGARYSMSGGYIRNAALRAAFLAASEGTQITTSLLHYAARLEYEGMGKIAA